ELARCHGAALAVAYLDNAIRTSNCGNRLQDTVVGDAVEERFVQVRVFAHIVLRISVQPHAVRAVSTGHDVENAFATRPTVACHSGNAAYRDEHRGRRRPGGQSLVVYAVCDGRGVASRLAWVAARRGARRVRCRRRASPCRFGSRWWPSR